MASTKVFHEGCVRSRRAHSTLSAHGTVNVSVATWEALTEASGRPAPRVFESKHRLFSESVPELKFWHDAAGWCPHCMVSWTVLEEMRIPYVMDTTPLRAYLKPGEKKRQRLVPVIQLLDKKSSDAKSWVFQDTMQGVGRGEQVCQMLAERYPTSGLWPESPTQRELAESDLDLFLGLQQAHSAYKRLPGGRPTWGVSQAHSKKDEQRLVAALDRLEAALTGSTAGKHAKAHQPSHGEAARDDLVRCRDADVGDDAFLRGATPYMVDLMMLPILERVEALLLHPFLGGSSGHVLSNWPRVSRMLAVGRKPGVCSFGELCSDAETLLAISLRDDGDRTPLAPLQGTVLQPPLAVLEATRAAAEHSAVACHDAAARICHKAIVAFACQGRGCGRGRNDIKQAAAAYSCTGPIVDLVLRSVVAALVLKGTPEYRALQLERDARAMARALQGDAKAAVPALRFLAQNIGVPRDMSAASAAALRAHLRVFIAALENRGPSKGISRRRSGGSGSETATGASNTQRPFKDSSRPSSDGGNREQVAGAFERRELS
eukprot:CAMPEP_0117552840 /NCGR_PEP_ID=MMETSP0784-20121206/49916_1 /TAXON_ID=39447 /ORGANISM="" /LENGTH=546 /DNA_ID=CAMNT_0005349927 /DNA_START=264 /DNA_END=1901 /DNA_ORIENTATION=+